MLKVRKYLRYHTKSSEKKNIKTNKECRAGQCLYMHVVDDTLFSNDEGTT